MLAALAVASAVYLGGTGADDCDDIAFDRAGFVYLACHSSSENFIGAEKKDFDAFVVKFDPRSSKIVYATRIGGSGWDAAFRVVVDVRGRVWVSGTTQSADFPFKNAERRHSDQGAINAFVARLDRDGAVEDMALVGDATGEGLVVLPDAARTPMTMAQLNALPAPELAKLLDLEASELATMQRSEPETVKLLIEAKFDEIAAAPTDKDGALNPVAWRYLLGPHQWTG